ncbi:MAG: hypothetical protein ACPGYT_11710 [Nitrospirales bacterium]
MSQDAHMPQHIRTTETFLRLYVLLAQYLDRCGGKDSSGSSISEGEFQKHLLETKATLANLLSSNRIVPAKVEQEYERVMKCGQALTSNPLDLKLSAQVEQEREELQIKSLVLSDLLAVFRSA